MFYKETPEDISKIICVDFDDTLSFTQNRDWRNAKPNIELIEKLNELQRSGWYILVLTARGSISCKSRKDADKKYRGEIEHFLYENGLIYNELSFNKPLATYYIDDKGMIPENFLDINITPIKKGKSGATVEQHGSEIYKTHTDSKEAAEWYIEANIAGLNVPTIKSLVGNTIRMEYVEHNDVLNYHAIKKQLNLISEHTLIPTERFMSYENRIIDHIDFGKNQGYFSDNEKSKILDALNKIRPFMDLHSTFMHGDFSIENMIFNQGSGLVLIDPIYIKNLYSSIYLDIAKLSHSARKHGNVKLVNFCYSIMKNYTDERDKHLLDFVLTVLEVTQWIRILKYHRDDPNFDEYLRITKTLIEEC